VEALGILAEPNQQQRTMRVAVYHRSVPNAKNQEKIDVLQYFAQGVQHAGDQLINVEDYSYQTSQVGVIQGWVGPAKITSEHQQLRNTVITNQIQSEQYVVTIDSNLFLYATPGNPDHYLRYSFNGVFPNTGIYCDTNVDSARWQKISSKLKIELKDYRTQGNHILLCLQRNGGWSMRDYDVVAWAHDTISEIRKHTSRPIVVRAHPGDKAAKQYISSIAGHNVIPSVNATLLDDLKNCWAVVNHNSSPVVGAAIEGYPIFVTDHAKSQCREIANTDLSTIETPILFDRQSWVERISMFHWNFDELRSGECWQHMRRYIT
jgi:hypothetical protein